MQAQMQGLFYLVLPYKLVLWFGSAHLLLLMVEEKTWNLGCSAPGRMGSSVQFPGNTQRLDLLVS